MRNVQFIVLACIVTAACAINKPNVGVRSANVHSLAGEKPTFSSAAGNITELTSNNFPILAGGGLSIRRLVLAPLGLRSPHWHTNGHELGYCLRGSVIVWIVDNGDVDATFLVTEGQMFFVPSGALHAIANAANSTAGPIAEVILGFSNPLPEDIGLSAAVATFSDAVLGDTFSLPSNAFTATTASIQSNPNDGIITSLPVPPTISVDELRLSPYKFDIEAQSAPIKSAVGSAKLARSQFWPILGQYTDTEISMYSLRIKYIGLREPHWHPRTTEMGYVAEGRARMSILDPNGTISTYEVGVGHVYFVPASYPHYIADVSDKHDALHILIFFDQAMPEDIGFRAALSMGFDTTTLASAFGMADNVDAFPKLPLTPNDPVLVARINPLDSDVADDTTANTVK